MDTVLPAVHTVHFNAVVEHVSSFESGLTHLRLLHEHEQIDAWSWLPMTAKDANSVLKAEVYAMPLDTPEGATHVVTRIVPMLDLDVFSLIPDRFGRTEDVVFRCRDVVDACATGPIRHFLSNVFSMPEVYRDFWNCPASQSHHHAYPGGLAAHSVEMGENVRDTPRLSDLERDVGIAHALIHDIGKLWCYSPDARHLQALGHELVGLGQLHQSLERLAADWPDGAVALRSLMSGQWKRLGGKPLMAVGSLVRAYDQASAEKDLRPRRRHPHRPWSPSTPDSGKVLPFRRDHRTPLP